MYNKNIETETRHNMVMPCPVEPGINNRRRLANRRFIGDSSPSHGLARRETIWCTTTWLCERRTCRFHEGLIPSHTRRGMISTGVAIICYSASSSWPISHQGSHGHGMIPPEYGTAPARVSRMCPLSPLPPIERQGPPPSLAKSVYTLSRRLASTVASAVVAMAVSIISKQTIYIEGDSVHNWVDQANIEDQLRHTMVATKTSKGAVLHHSKRGIN